MKTVFLSAGHSDSDPGAVATIEYETGSSTIIKESDVALDFRKMVALYLERAGVTFGTDGQDGVNLPLSMAAKMAREYNIAVEFHCNASDNTSATGVEVLSAEDDKDLADDISSAIANALGIKNRGAKPENAGQHHRLAFVQAGGLIVELFFLSNPNDRRAYAATKWVAARDVANVLIEYAGKGQPE